MSLSSSKSLTITSISSTAHVWHLGSSLLLLSQIAQYGISQTSSVGSGVAGARSNGKNFIYKKHIFDDKLLIIFWPFLFRLKRRYFK